MPNHLHGIVMIGAPVGDEHRSSLGTEGSLPEQYNDFNFAWQRFFHDHIIRNDVALYNIKKYIKENLIPHILL